MILYLCRTLTDNRYVIKITAMGAWDLILTLTF